MSYKITVQQQMLKGHTSTDLAKQQHFYHHGDHQEFSHLLTQKFGDHCNKESQTGDTRKKG